MVIILDEKSDFMENQILFYTLFDLINYLQLLLVIIIIFKYNVKYIYTTRFAYTIHN